jgi:hypothetical protein
MLDSCPLVTCLGSFVNDRSMAYIWLPQELPYYVTDVSKLIITCPEDCKIRADRLDHNVPIFKETVTFTKGLPAAMQDELQQCLPCEPEGGSAPAEEAEPEEWVEDLSEMHALTHLPKCKKCDVCMKTKCFFTPHRKIENQSAERQEAAAQAVPVKFLGRVLLDHAIISKENEGRNHETASLRIIDEYTGAAMSYPTSVRDADSVRTALLHFAGPYKAKFVVKYGSDRAAEIIAAGKALGWIHEGSTPNSKIHNPVAERGIRSSKDGASCNLEQSGLPHKDWPYAQEHHDLVRTFTQHAPSDGIDDPRHGLTKFQAACGRKFDGKLITFGALVWYKVPPIGLPPFAPKTVPGIFLGWEVQADFRWRGTYKVADYEALRTGKLKVVLVKEIVRPSGKFCYPLATAKLAAIQHF